LLRAAQIDLQVRTDLALLKWRDENAIRASCE
jgi:hypothetical protein